MGIFRIFYRTMFRKNFGLNFEFEKSLLRGARKLASILPYFVVGLFVSVREEIQKKTENKTKTNKMDNTDGRM